MGWVLVAQPGVDTGQGTDTVRGGHTGCNEGLEMDPTDGLTANVEVSSLRHCRVSVGAAPICGQMWNSK